MNNVAIYVRLSYEEQNKNNNEHSKSIKNQLHILRKFAQINNLNVYKEYIDDGYSGMTFNRPAFEELLNDIDNKKISLVITKDFSRLGRNFIETVFYISEFFPKNNVRYISINDDYDSQNPNEFQNDIIIKIKTLMNAQTCKNASIKRKRTAEIQTEEGNFIGFIAPYGYNIVKKDNIRTLQIDPIAAKVIKRIFTEVAANKSISDLVDELNNENIPSPFIYQKMTVPKNKSFVLKWNNSTIYRILKNKTYIGCLVKRKSYKQNYMVRKRIFIPNKQREVIENHHEPIVSNKLFEEANNSLRVLAEKRNNLHQGKFNDLVICGVCGKTMKTWLTEKQKKSGTKQSYVYACKRRTNGTICSNRTIYESKLENIVKHIVDDLINTYIDKNETVKEIIEDSNLKNKNNSKIKVIETEIKLHEANIKKLYIDKTNCNISLDSFLTYKSLEQEKIQKLKEELQNKITNNDYLKIKKELLNNYEDFIKGNVLLQDYIKNIIDKIIVYKDNTIEIRFKFNLIETKKICLY